MFSLYNLRWMAGSFAIAISLMAFGCQNKTTENTTNPVQPPDETPNPGVIPPPDPNPEIGGGFSVLQSNEKMPYISCDLALSLTTDVLKPIQEKCLTDCTQLNASGDTLNCEAQCQVPLSRCGHDVQHITTRQPTEPRHTDPNQPTTPAETYDPGPNDPLFALPSLCSSSGQDMDRRLCIIRPFTLNTAHPGRNDDWHIDFKSKYRTLYTIHRKTKITSTFLHLYVFNYPGEPQKKGFKFYFQGLDGCVNPVRCPGRILRFPAGRQGNRQRYDMQVGVIKKSNSTCRLRMQLLDPGATNSYGVKLDLIIESIRC